MMVNPAAGLKCFGVEMNKLFCVLALLLFIPAGVAADFSNSQLTLHPHFPVTDPFIIEIEGTWPTDCHPGEQKPVIDSYDGQRVVIGFDIIIVHVTCNTIDTHYRVLVDMSEAVLETRPAGESLALVMNFQGEPLEQTLQLVCQGEGECAPPLQSFNRPEAGLYDNPQLLNQGLLLARQYDAMGVFPLVYDDAGASQWLFSGGHMVEDTFFTDIMLPDGGDCFGCEATNVEPGLSTIGRLSVLADRPGVLQVKINDGLFNEYHRTVYGYRNLHIGPSGEQVLVDLEGRWGISENRGTNPPAGDLTDYLPGAFDLVLENKPAAYKPPYGQVSYLLQTPTGETLGQLVCSGQTSAIDNTNACEFIDPTDAAEPLLWFYQQGPSSLSIEFGRPVPAVGIAPGGKAVRLD
jgi:hypothetical protein